MLHNIFAIKEALKEGNREAAIYESLNECGEVVDKEIQSLLNEARKIDDESCAKDESTFFEEFLLKLTARVIETDSYDISDHWDIIETDWELGDEITTHWNLEEDSQEDIAEYFLSLLEIKEEKVKAHAEWGNRLLARCLKEVA